MSFIWWVNVIGIIFSGTGAFMLAYDVFSFRPMYPSDSWGSLLEKPKHEKKNQNLVKAALIFIPLGAALQLLAIFLDT
jgi:hypothetical protein